MARIAALLAVFASAFIAVGAACQREAEPLPADRAAEVVELIESGEVPLDVFMEPSGPFGRLHCPTPAGPSEIDPASCCDALALEVTGATTSVVGVTVFARQAGCRAG